MFSPQVKKRHHEKLLTLVRYLHILSWLSFYMSYYSLRIHIKHLDFLKEKKNRPITKITVLHKKRKKGLSTFNNNNNNNNNNDNDDDDDDDDDDDNNHNLFTGSSLHKE